MASLSPHPPRPHLLFKKTLGIASSRVWLCMVGYDHVSVCVCTILGMVCRYITAHDSHVQHTWEWLGACVANVDMEMKLSCILGSWFLNPFSLFSSLPHPPSASPSTISVPPPSLFSSLLPSSLPPSLPPLYLSSTISLSLLPFQPSNFLLFFPTTIYLYILPSLSPSLPPLLTSAHTSHNTSATSWQISSQS